MSLPAWIPLFGPLSDRRKAFRELPEFAARWGLQFTESDRRYDIGIIDGTWEGRTVDIRPDIPMVTVHFARVFDEFSMSLLDLGEKRRGPGLGHPKFEKMFPSIELLPQQTDALRENHAVLDRVLALHRNHRVTGIMITQLGLACTMYNPWRYFSRNLPYFTAADLERLLPEMIEIVQTLESILPEKK